MNSTAKMGNETGFVHDGYYKLPMAAKVPKLMIEIAIALVGVLGNLLVCVVITKRASMKTTMNLYLRSLAIADLGVLLVNYPLIIIAQMSPFPFGKSFCLYIAPATEIFYGASIWSITVIAIERYRNIISRRSFGKRPESSMKTNLKILLLWFVSFIVVAVPMYPYMLYLEDSKACYPDWPQHNHNIEFILYTVGLAVFWYLLPLAIITFTYVKISKRLTQSNQFHKEMHDGGNNFAKSQLIRDEEKQRLKQNKKAQRILTPLVAVFAVSMLPLTVFRLAFAFYPAFLMYKYYQLLLSLCALFVVINSAADPIVYYISSKEFRKVLEAYLCKKGRESVLSTSHVDSPAISTAVSVQTKV